jgi:hypothetical protein
MVLRFAEYILRPGTMHGAMPEKEELTSVHSNHLEGGLTQLPSLTSVAATTSAFAMDPILVLRADESRDRYSGSFPELLAVNGRAGLGRCTCRGSARSYAHSRRG